MAWYDRVVSPLLGRRGRHRSNAQGPAVEAVGTVIGNPNRASAARSQRGTDRRAQPVTPLLEGVLAPADMPTADPIGQSYGYVQQSDPVPGVIGAVYGRRRNVAPETPDVEEPQPSYPTSYLPGANSRTRSLAQFEHAQIIDTRLCTAEGNRISVNLADGSVFVNDGNKAVALTRVWTPNIAPGPFRNPTSEEATFIESEIAHRLQMTVDERPPLRWVLSQSTVHRTTGPGRPDSPVLNEIIDTHSGRRGHIVVDENERRAYAQFENEALRHDLGPFNLSEARSAELAKELSEQGLQINQFALEVHDLRSRYGITGDGPVQWDHVESVRHFQDAQAIVQGIDLARPRHEQGLA